METSRVLVLTTTATSEDVLLIIDMEYEHKQDRNALRERKETIQHGEVIEIVEETLEEINAAFPPETLEPVADNFQDPLQSHGEEPRPEVVNCDRENSHENNNNYGLHDETCEEVNFSLKLPPTGQMEDSVMEEIDEYCDISDESDDDDYEYYYEEITDDDESDDDKK